MQEQMMEFSIRTKKGTEGKIYVKAYSDTNISNVEEIESIFSVKMNAVEPKRGGKIEEAVRIVREELLKHDSLYDGFLASILSVLEPREGDTGDGESTIYAEFGAQHLAEEILSCLIGEER